MHPIFCASEVKALLMVLLSRNTSRRLFQKQGSRPTTKTITDSCRCPFFFARRKRLACPVRLRLERPANYRCGRAIPCYDRQKNVQMSKASEYNVSPHADGMTGGRSKNHVHHVANSRSVRNNGGADRGWAGGCGLAVLAGQRPSRRTSRSPGTKAVMLDKILQVRGIRGIVYRFGQLGQRAAHALSVTHDFARLKKGGNGYRISTAAVIVGRNDDYMPDFKKRLRATVEWNIRYLVDEVVFVEWNPPAGRELLSTGLEKSFSCLRAYVVSPEIHESICRNAHLPLLEFHAKNVGIRRARSNWIVATNADTAFGPDTIRRLLRTKLTDDVVWSAQRIDIPWREGRETGRRRTP